MPPFICTGVHHQGRCAARSASAERPLKQNHFLLHRISKDDRFSSITCCASASAAEATTSLTSLPLLSVINVQVFSFVDPTDVQMCDSPCHAAVNALTPICMPGQNFPCMHAQDVHDPCRDISIQTSLRAQRHLSLLFLTRTRSCNSWASQRTSETPFGRCSAGAQTGRSSTSEPGYFPFLKT